MRARRFLGAGEAHRQQHQAPPPSRKGGGGMPRRIRVKPRKTLELPTLPRIFAGMVGNSMQINALSPDQARNLVDTRQAYEALLGAESMLDRRFSGTMQWRKRAASDYLYRIHSRGGKRVERSIGPRSAETEAAFAAFREGRARAADAVAGLRERLERIAPVNVALGLGRVPDVVARIIRRLDENGLLGEAIAIVGTNAIFAYEAAAGVQVEGGLLATTDVDIALDARRSLTLAGRMLPDGLLGMLRKIDDSFHPRRDGHYRAVNRGGFMVDLITAEPRNALRRRATWRLSVGVEDLAAAEIGKLQWLTEAPRFTAVAIAQNGLPVRMVAADPRFFAAHKLWMAERGDREPEKRGRDRLQAQAIAALLAGPLSTLPLDDSVLSQLPPPLRQNLREAVAAADIPRPAW